MPSSRLIAHSLLLLTAFIWGLTFVFQKAGMEYIGATGFNTYRFIAASVALLPAAIFEYRSKSILTTAARSVSPSPKVLYLAMIGLGLVMFIGSLLQQISLVSTSVANAAFLTTLYVPLVPIFGLLLFRIHLPAVRWAAVGVFIIGSWLMTGASPAKVVLGDGIVTFSACFWAFHIMLVGYLVQKTSAPLQLAFIQTSITAVLSLIVFAMIDTIDLSLLPPVLFYILFAGILSTAFAFTLQIFAQRHCSAAAAAIILSLESVVAAVGGWVILSHSMTTVAIVGAGFIFIAVLIIELSPMKH